MHIQYSIFSHSIQVQRQFDRMNKSQNERQKQNEIKIQSLKINLN